MIEPATALGGAVLTLLLILTNAFFVAAEFSLVRIHPTQLQVLADGGSKAAARVLRSLSQLDAYLSATQAGVTISSLILGWVSEPLFASLLAPLFGPLLDVNKALFEVISFILAFGVLTYLHIVFGELAPKYLSLQQTLRVALVCSLPLTFFVKLLSPLIWVINHSALKVLRLMGIKPTGKLNAHSGEELKLLVSASADEGIIENSERDILHNVLTFADDTLAKVMVPRTEVLAIEENATVEQLVTLARQKTHARFPLYKDDLDQLTSVVHLRDLVKVDAHTYATTPLSEIARKLPAIPEKMRLDAALKFMQREHVQMCVVIDEFGGTAGIVTSEDIIEELVGELDDEFHREKVKIRKQQDGSFLIEGHTPHDDVCKALQLLLPEDKDVDGYHTVAGLVLKHLGHVPIVGEKVNIGVWTFTVTLLDGRRIATLKATRSKLNAA